MALLDEIRSAVAGLMAEIGSEVRFERVTAGGYDYDTGATAVESTSTIYEGPALFNGFESKGVVAEDSDATLIGNLMEVRVPIDATLPEIGDRCVIVTAPTDPQAVDQEWWVVKVPVGSHQSTRQVLVADWRQENHTPRGNR